MCGGTSRHLLHEELIDNVFFVAPGRWQLHRCATCRSAYLDPRPNRTSIGKAYGAYYTHAVDASAQASADQLSLLRRVRRAISNSYLNERFGTRRLPAYKWGFLLAKLFPYQRQLLDSEFRYLPKPRAGQRLLDIGCGNGAFLAKAKAAGWSVTGIDLDPKAVTAAVTMDIDVKVGSVELFANESNVFDAITLSHVIEHVHEPIRLLNDVFRLLRSGGIVYLETPNIDSFGSKIYKKNWRGIEAPRHLIIFNHKSLKDALKRTGFQATRFFTRKNVLEGIFHQSENLRQRQNPLEKNHQRLSSLYRWVGFLQLIAPKKNEFITITARKP